MVDPAGAVEESLRHQAVHGVLWTALQKWSVRLSTFIAFLLLGRLLTPHDFGVVALAMSFIVLLTVIADAGFATYLVQVRELTETTKNTAFYIATGAGIALALLLSLAAYPLSRLMDVHQLAVVLPALSISLVFVGLSSVPAALLQRELRFQQLAMRQVLATGLSVVAAVALAAAGAGVWALVAQTLVRQVVASTVLMAATDFRPHRIFSRDEAGVMLSYSTKAMGAQILAQGRDQGEVLLIGAIAGPVALGLWTVASRLVNVLGDLLGTVIGTVAVPLFARVQSEPARLSRAVSATAGLGTLVLAPALGALALLSPELIPDVFGNQWKAATGVAAILALRGIFTALSSLDRSVLLTAGRAGGELRLISIITVVHCVLVAVFARHGVETLAFVVLIEAVLFAPVRPYLLHVWLGVKYRCYLGAGQAMAAAGVAGGLTWLTLRLLDVDGPMVYPLVVLAGGSAYALLVAILARPVVRELLSALALVRARRHRPQVATA